MTDTLTKEQEAAIREQLKARSVAIAAVLASSASGVILASAKDAGVDYTKAEYTAMRARVMKEYTANLQKGGTMCVERVLTPVGNGMVKATTRQVFVPWLADKAERESDEIIALIRQRQAEGMNPRRIAKELEGYFEGTRHNALTAARTEASKIRNDVNVILMENNGTKYVQYVTAGDDKVRPEHEMRNGKIYKLEDAPFLGEYGCRCVLVPADYLVKTGGKVENTEAEYINKSQAGL